MNNLFGKSLRSQMEKAGIKESELADALSYDTTYISKWINGSKLPSVRNAERILGQMADFLLTIQVKAILRTESVGGRAVLKN